MNKRPFRRMGQIKKAILRTHGGCTFDHRSMNKARRAASRELVKEQLVK